jgi:sec-independent protein translocase protein TatA
MPFGIGVPELLILLVVILLVFGPKRLPEMGRSLGRGMREFKDSISGKEEDETPAQSHEITSTGHEIVTPTPSERERDAVS